MHVVGSGDDVGCGFAGSPELRFAKSGTRQQLFRLQQSDGASRDAASSEANLARPTVGIHANKRTDSGNRIVAMPACDLVKGPAAVRWQDRKSRLYGDLIALSGRRQVKTEKIIGLDLASARRALDYTLPPSSTRISGTSARRRHGTGCRRRCRRSRMGTWRNVRHCFDNERIGFAHPLVELELAMAGHRFDDDLVALDGDALESDDMLDVNEK